MKLMQEQSRYVVGIDIGTKNVRCVVGYIDAENGAPKIVGVGEHLIVDAKGNCNEFERPSWGYW